VRPNEQVDLVFILHAINAIKDEILERRRGVRQKNLSLGKIKDIELPMPPLPEQRRIVGILGEAFEGIATAKANAEKNSKTPAPSSRATPIRLHPTWQSPCRTNW